MLGVMDTIANNEAEYIEIAVRLVLKERIVEQMVQRHLYDDRTCVEALEAFYRRSMKVNQQPQRR